MVLLVPLALLVVCFVLADLALAPPAWLRAAGRAVAGRAGAAAPRLADQDWDLFSLPFVRARLAALDNELMRLDRDPGIFARAFKTLAAKAAYDALLADAERLSRVTTLDLSGELELAGAPRPHREELEL